MNKYKYFILLSFFLFIFSINKCYAWVNGFSLSGKIIYLDAGHGGVDSGAIYGNIYEKDINLILVKKLERLLTSYGAIVYLTRNGDYDLSNGSKMRKRGDLSNRAYLINNSICDMYISIHLNYISDSRWRGVQIFYTDKNELNNNIAKSFTDFLKKNYYNVRDYKENNTYYMYNLINKPGILIEAGFLSNVNDRYLLTKERYQDKLVECIMGAIINFYLEKD